MGRGDSKKFYEMNPEKYVERKKQIHARHRQIRDRVVEYKKGKECVQCGFSDYRALDFHHTTPNEKRIELSLIHNKGWKWERIQEEIDKCILLCRNCHAILHADERDMPH